MLNPDCEQMKMEFASNEAVCAKVLDLFHLLSNKARFRIVCLLARGEYCVHEIAEVVGAGHLSNISQHLRMLAMAGVITRRRDGTHIRYTLTDDRIRNMIDYLRVQFLERQEETANA